MIRQTPRNRAKAIVGNRHYPNAWEIIEPIAEAVKRLGLRGHSGCIVTRLCTKSRFVGGGSDADFAQLHRLVSVAAHDRGQRPLPQTFCAKPYRGLESRAKGPEPNPQSPIRRLCVTNDSITEINERKSIEYRPRSNRVEAGITE